VEALGEWHLQYHIAAYFFQERPSVVGTMNKGNIT
jgi:hypothetical protein